MGKALYRKYRPKSLGQIAGQEHITKTLSAAIASNKISHAYLFTGPKGVGKTSIARILAHEVNGLKYEDDSPHVDIIEIDAASNRRIDEIRELREMVYIAPTQAKYKVYIIDEVHMLTKEAFNALLKTLEEPPQHVIFILATTDAHKLPDTIVSRTQRYSFKPINPDAVANYLKYIAKEEKISIDDDAIALITEHGQGSLRDSVSLLDQASNTSDKSIGVDKVSELLGLPPRKSIVDIVDMIFTNGSTSELVKTLNSLYESGYDENVISKELSALIRQRFIDGKIQDKDLVISLLSELLNTPLSYNPKAYLELCLIKAVPNSPKIVKEKIVNTEPEEEINQTEEVTSIEVELPKKVKASKVSEQPSVNLDISSWPEVLKALKSKHNTLYSIVRMAEPEFSDGEVKLTFEFEFHIKQLNQAANRKMLDEVMKSMSGSDINIVLEKKSSEKPAEKKDLGKVSAIFNGAELLES
jgi:DNA polymerase-3 subunit gamma/tau